jgi:negative regulator of replication initiation
MPHSIDIDDDVFAALQRDAEPFVDTPNSVLRRLLGLDKNTSTARRQQSTEEPATASRRAPERVTSRSRRRSTQRAARGSLLPESEYVKTTDAHRAERLWMRSGKPSTAS